eukprot:g15442.t1
MFHSGNTLESDGAKSFGDRRHSSADEPRTAGAAAPEKATESGPDPLPSEDRSAWGRNNLRTKESQSPDDPGRTSVSAVCAFDSRLNNRRLPPLLFSSGIAVLFSKGVAFLSLRDWQEISLINKQTLQASKSQKWLGVIVLRGLALPSDRKGLWLRASRTANVIARLQRNFEVPESMSQRLGKPDRPRHRVDVSDTPPVQMFQSLDFLFPLFEIPVGYSHQNGGKVGVRGTLRLLGCIAKASRDAVFSTLKAAPLPDHKQTEIARDVCRTFPYLADFGGGSGGGSRGRVFLREVLHATSVAHPEIGYCQGMNFVAGVLLIHTGFDAGACFALLCALIEHYDYRYLFSPGVPLLGYKSYQFAEIVGEGRHPKLKQKLHKFGFSLDIFSHQWIMTLFSYVVDPVVCGFLWDAFFLRGWPALFAIGSALLRLMHKPILSVDCLEQLSRVMHGQKTRVREFLAGCLVAGDAGLVGGGRGPAAQAAEGPGSGASPTDAVAKADSVGPLEKAAAASGPDAAPAPDIFASVENPFGSPPGTKLAASSSTSTASPSPSPSPAAVARETEGRDGAVDLIQSLDFLKDAVRVRKVQLQVAKYLYDHELEVDLPKLRHCGGRFLVLKFYQVLQGFSMAERKGSRVQLSGTFPVEPRFEVLPEGFEFDAGAGVLVADMRHFACSDQAGKAAGKAAATRAPLFPAARRLRRPVVSKSATARASAAASSPPAPDGSTKRFFRIPDLLTCKGQLEKLQTQVEQDVVVLQSRLTAISSELARRQAEVQALKLDVAQVEKDAAVGSRERLVGELLDVCRVMEESYLGPDETGNEKGGKQTAKQALRERHQELQRSVTEATVKEREKTNMYDGKLAKVQPLWDEIADLEEQKGRFMQDLGSILVDADAEREALLSELWEAYSHQLAITVETS